MTTKQIAKEMIEKLPNDVSLQEIAQRIAFVAGIKQAEEELDRGEGIPFEEIEKEWPSWIIR